jgi:hypothetical protein
MTNVERMTRPECRTGSRPAAGSAFVIGISDFLRHWAFVIRHSHRSVSIGATLATRPAGAEDKNRATHIDPQDFSWYLQSGVLRPAFASGTA